MFWYNLLGLKLFYHVLCCCVSTGGSLEKAEVHTFFQVRNWGKTHPRSCRNKIAELFVLIVFQHMPKEDSFTNMRNDCCLYSQENWLLHTKSEGPWVAHFAHGIRPPRKIIKSIALYLWLDIKAVSSDMSLISLYLHMSAICTDRTHTHITPMQSFTKTSPTIVPKEDRWVVYNTHRQLWFNSCTSCTLSVWAAYHRTMWSHWCDSMWC